MQAVEKKYYKFMDVVRGIISQDEVLFFVYLIYKTKINKSKFEEEIKNLNSQITNKINDKKFVFAYSKIIDVLDDLFTKDDYKDFILYNSSSIYGRFSYSTTSSEIIKLISQIISSSHNLKVADFCSGEGFSLMELKRLGSNDITSVEINKAFLDNQKIRNEVCDVKAKYIKEDIFSFSTNNPEEKFDLIFSDFPWDRVENNNANAWKSSVLESYIPKNRLEWKFITLVFSHIKKTGKAIVLAPLGIEFQVNSKDIREEFISKGYIEKIIELPSGILHHTGVQSLLIVLSYGNKKIEFIDASNVYSEEGRKKYFSEEDLEMIFSNKFFGKSIISKEEVLKEGRLLPSYYNVPKVLNSIELSEVASIIRGQNYKRNELDNLVSDTLTEIELVRTSNLIDFGIYNADCLSEMPEKTVVLENNDILITRVSSSKEAAIYNKGDFMSIVDQSLMIIRVDNNKIDPYYLFGYLISNKGKEHLRTAYSPNIISQVSVASLKRVKVPLLPMAEQEVISRVIKKNLSEISKKRVTFFMALEKNIEDTNKFFGG